MADTALSPIPTRGFSDQATLPSPVLKSLERLGTIIGSVYDLIDCEQANLASFGELKNLPPTDPRTTGVAKARDLLDSIRGVALKMWQTFEELGIPHNRSAVIDNQSQSDRALELLNGELTRFGIQMKGLDQFTDATMVEELLPSLSGVVQALGSYLDCIRIAARSGLEVITSEISEFAEYQTRRGQPIINPLTQLTTLLAQAQTNPSMLSGITLKAIYSDLCLAARGQAPV